MLLVRVSFSGGTFICEWLVFELIYKAHGKGLEFTLVLSFSENHSWRSLERNWERETTEVRRSCSGVLFWKFTAVNCCTPIVWSMKLLENSKVDVVTIGWTTINRKLCLIVFCSSWVLGDCVSRFCWFFLVKNKWLFIWFVD